MTEQRNRLSVLACIAQTLSLTAANVSAMPSPTPVPASDLTGVNVLVIAGADIGGAGSTNTTQAPAGNTIAPSPPSTSSVHTTTTVLHTTTTAAHTTTTVSHTTTTVSHTTTT